MWIEDLTDALAALHRSDEGFMVVQLVGTPYYVQLLRDEVRPGQPRAFVEAVSNEYLVGAESLTPEQEAALRGLGWQRPGSACDPVERCEMEHLNWFCIADLEAPGAAQGALVGLVLATLGVFGLAEGTRVSITTGSNPGLQP